jgi:hypothetical protein
VCKVCSASTNPCPFDMDWSCCWSEAMFVLKKLESCVVLSLCLPLVHLEKLYNSGGTKKMLKKESKNLIEKKMCSRNQSRSSCCWRGYPSVGGGKKGHSFVLLLLFLFVVETVQGHLLSVLKILLMLSCWEKGLSVIITAGSSYEGFSYEENNRILSYNSQVF